jgi:mono/diheme cytochrome c family protein
MVRGLYAYEAWCAACHAGGADSAIAGVGEAPPLELLRSRPALAVRPAMQRGAHALPNARPAWGVDPGSGIEQDIAQFVVASPLRPAEAAAAIASYHASPAGVPDGARADYVHFCSGCHGPHGAGDALVSRAMAERLGPTDLIDSVRYSALSDRDLREFIGLRGVHEQHARFMPSWSSRLDSSRVTGLVAYLRSISRTRSRP